MHIEGTSINAEAEMDVCVTVEMCKSREMTLEGDNWCFWVRSLWITKSN
jgi:hypothetical protein